MHETEPQNRLSTKHQLILGRGPRGRYKDQVKEDLRMLRVRNWRAKAQGKEESQR